MNSNNIIHLYTSIGFGINKKELKKISNNSKIQALNNLFTTSKLVTPTQNIFCRFN